MISTTNSRKFLNTDAPIEVSPQGGGFNVAELMAHHGVKSDGNSSVEIPPINITETKEQAPPTAQEPPTATVEQTPNAETVTPETPAPQVEQKVEVTPQIEIPQPVAPTWQEVLKQQQPETVLKELGLDASVVSLAKEIRENDKMISFYQHWKNNNGDVTSYLKELSTDYTKMPPEEVMRHQLRQDYPKATDKQLEVLFNKEVIQAYNLDSEDETELETGRLLLEAKAERYREGLLQNQQKYLFSKPPEPSQPTSNPLEEMERSKQQEQEKFTSFIDGDQYTKSIFAAKQYVVGEGEEAFKFPIDPQNLRDNLVNADKWASKLFIEKQNPDGSKAFVPDVEKQYLVSMIAEYGMGYINALANHYKTLGGKATIAPIENASQPDGSTASKAEAEPKTPAAAMARYGTLK